MQKFVSIALFGCMAAGGATASIAADKWETLVNRGNVRIDLNVSSIEKGANGGIQAYVLTMHSEPKTTPDGAAYKNSTAVMEWDCVKQLTWLHGIAYEMQSKLVGLRKYPNAEASRFMPPETLGGATERAACLYLRRQGLL